MYYKGVTDMAKKLLEQQQSEDLKLKDRLVESEVRGQIETRKDQEQVQICRLKA